jgi:hypothetical protein
MQHGYQVVADFFDGANELRAAFEAHFRRVEKQSSDHQVWNYWYVPEAFTYLRTYSESIASKELIVRFLQRLNAWSAANLGLVARTRPWLNLFINGCGMSLHNDAQKGQMAYVLSITKWDTRNFVGGETILVRPENYWQTERIKQAVLETYYQKIPALFNQLLVFDDRIIHGVQPIQGTMDPLAGRLVLVGQLTAEAMLLNGSLPRERAMPVMSPLMEKIGTLARHYAERLDGFMTLRLFIQPDGRVASVQVLCDRVLPLSADTSPIGDFKQQVTDVLAGARFPPSEGPTEITVPLVVGT